MLTKIEQHIEEGLPCKSTHGAERGTRMLGITEAGLKAMVVAKGKARDCEDI